MKVLIAEDDAISRRMLESLLPMWGYEVITTAGGRAALETLQQRDPPRLAILDWMMPDLDGLEVTKRVRALRGLHYVHILLLTVKDSRSDLVDGLEAGADDYLAKPFDPNELRARLHAARRSLVAHDRLEQLTMELSRKNHKLGELTETAHRFVDNVSHEFRTPLTVIKEFTSIITDGLGGPVTETQTEYLHMITNAVHDLTQMVDDLLDSSKLKAGTLRVDRHQLDVREIFDAVRPLVTPKAAMRGITVHERINEPLPEIFGDREKATRVLVNLVVNAVKFSPQGSTVEVRATATRDDEVTIAVQDRGPGLTAEEQRVIFERFRQVGAGNEGSTKGFGLGLNIAGELAWLNLGTMSVTSDRDRIGDDASGSTFAFTMPVNDPEVILDQYFERLRELSSPAGSLAVLRIAPEGDGSIDEIRRFLTASCYPTDLVLRSPDENAVWAIGTTDSPDGWAARLDALRVRAIHEQGREALPPLDITRSGLWLFPDEGGEARVHLVRQMTQGAGCAA